MSSQIQGLSDGERKYATVLFADIVNSSDLVADADPEEANDLLLPWLRAMVEAVDRYGGTVTQLLGDGVMALFGAPTAQEHHAVRACLAAQDIQRRCAQTQARGQLGVPTAVQVRVGISSGEIVTQSIRSGMLEEYRAVGDSVYLASRAEQAAQPGQVVLTEETYRLVAGQVDVSPAPMVRLNDKSRSFKAYALEAVKIAKRRMRPLELQAGASFVGREEDLTALRNSLARAKDGEGEVIVITGDAGVGKSRLIDEYLSGVDTAEVRVLKVDLEPTGVPRFEEPIVRMVRSLLDIEASAEFEGLEAKVGERLEALRLHVAHNAAAVLDVLGYASHDPVWQGIDPPQRLRLTLMAIADVVRMSSRRRPLILILEDFHWASSEVQQLGKDIAARLDGTRLQLILTSRTHHERPWLAWPRVVQHRIRALRPEDAARFVETLLGQGGEGELVNRLIEKTQGNPFFIEECVHSLAEQSALKGSPGRYRLAVPIDEIDIPVTVHGVLAERIDSLATGDRRALLCAAVIGPNFDVTLLEQLQPGNQKDLSERLSRLEEQGFLQRTRIVPNVEYGFRHTLTHEVAYGTLLKRDRLRLHAAAVEIIRSRPAHGLPIKVTHLAHHAYCAENWPRALAYCRRAASKAQAASRNAEASTRYDQALHALQQLPDTLRNRRRGIDIRLEYVQSLITLGHPAKVREMLEVSGAVAKELGDELRLGRTYSAHLINHWVEGELGKAEKVARRALDLARRLNDSQLEIQVASRFGYLLIDQGAYAEARQLLEDIIPRIPDRSSHKQFGMLAAAAVACRASLARSLGELGKFREALQVGDEAVRIADESGHGFSQTYAYLFVGVALLRKGDFNRSIPLLERAHESCQMTQIGLFLPFSAASLGHALVRTGQVAAGLGLLEHAIELAKGEVVLAQLSQQTAWLAEALLRAGQPKEALAQATAALNIARKNGEKGDQAWAQWALGEVHRCSPQGSATKAASAFKEARNLAEDCQMLPLVAHCDLALAQLQPKGLAKDHGLKRAQDALELYERLDMGTYAAMAQKVLAGDPATVN